MKTSKNFRIHKLTDNQYIHAELAEQFSDNDVCIVEESLKLSATPDTLADVIAYAKPGTTITLSADNYAALDLSGVKAYPDNLTIEGVSVDGVPRAIINGITISDTIKDELACAVSDRAMPSNLVLRNLTFSGPVCVYNCNITGLAISDCFFNENAYLHIRPNQELVNGAFESVPFYETRTANNISIRSCTFEGTTENNADVVYLSCVNNTSIHHNTINNASGSGIKIYGEKGIDKASSGKIAVVGNKIQNIGDLGIDLSLFDNANICVLYNTINNGASDIVIRISEFDIKSEFITVDSNGETNTRDGYYIGSYDDEPEKRFVKGIEVLKNLTELEQAHIDIERKLEQHKDDTDNPHNIKGIIDEALANHTPTDLQLATKRLIFTLANGEQIEMNVYVSDKPVEPDIPVTPETYKITVNGVEYTAEKDMTWGQFIGSAYNTVWVSECCGETLKTFIAISGPMKTRSLAYVGYRVCSCGSGYYLLDSAGNYIKTEDLVDNTKTYVIEALPCSHNMEVSYTWDADHNSCTATATCTKCQYTFDETVYSKTETDSEDSNQFRHYVDFTSGLFSRQYCNAWHEQNDEITFYIDGNQLSCPAGYTWYDFINSEYNSSFGECDCDTAVKIVGYYDDGNGDDYEIRVNWCSTCNTYDGLLSYSGGNVVTLNNEILDNHEYSIHQHNLAYVSTVAPTCNKDGYEIWTCQADHCYYNEYKNTTPAKHSYVNGICSLCGVKDPGYVCTHSYNSVVTQPTCTEQGYTTHTCSKCGNSYKDSFVEPGHVWDNGTITIEPGCESTGVKTFTCTRDNSHTRTEIVPATGHTDKNNDYICDTCSKDLCTEHSVQITTGYAATCQLPGLTDGKHCSICGQIIVQQTPIPALGHNMQETSAEIPATCAESGKTAIYTCANGCGKTEGGEEIQATGHNFVLSKSVDPTCIEDGYDVYKCACGETDTRNGKAASDDNHNFLPYEDAIAPTCTSVGYKATEKCMYCNAVIGGGEIATIAHNYSETTIPATCTEGTKIRYICSICNDSYDSEPYDDLAPHTWENGKCAVCEHTCMHPDNKVSSEPVTEPTCTTPGEMQHICDICGYCWTEEIPMTEHDYVRTVTPATCETNAWVSYVCSCGAESTEPSDCGEQPDTKTPHDWDPYMEIEATCTENGEIRSHCLACGKEKTEEIPMTGHDYQEVIEPATCTSGSIVAYICSKCGNEDQDRGYDERDDKIPHDYEGYSCTMCGKARYGTCSHCEDPLTEDEICSSMQGGPSCDGYYSVYCDCGDTLINGICPSCGANNLTCDNENCGSSFSASSYSEGDTCPDCGIGTLTSEPESEQELCGNCDSPLTNNICTNKECIACPDYEDPDSEPEYCDWCGQYPCECTLCPSCLYGSLNHAGICNNCDYKGEDSGDDFCDDCGEQLTDGECTNYENCPRYVDYCECGERLDELGNCALGEECPAKKREED